MVDQWEKVRRLVLARDGENCLRCLQPATDVHHRLPRGMGGTRNEYITFGVANLVSLCRECHNFIHQHPALAYETGFLVHSWDDPADIPLRVGTYSALLKLTSSGDIERVGNVLLF